MSSTSPSLDALKDIKRIMEKSGRFISLSGWSGIAAGVCGLVGAAIAFTMLDKYKGSSDLLYPDRGNFSNDSLGWNDVVQRFFFLAAIVFVVAFLTAFLFTYLRSKRQGIAIWGSSAQRLLWNTLVPMVAGGVFVLRLIAIGDYMLIAPACLIFYGLGLINGSKYTLGEVKYLGYFELALGIMSLWLIGYGLIFWALGFGVLHIIYGALMWWKYERKATIEQ